MRAQPRAAAHSVQQPEVRESEGKGEGEKVGAGEWVSEGPGRVGGG